MCGSHCRLSRVVVGPGVPVVFVVQERGQQVFVVYKCGPFAGVIVVVRGSCLLMVFCCACLMWLRLLFGCWLCWVGVVTSC